MDNKDDSDHGLDILVAGVAGSRATQKEAEHEKAIAIWIDRLQRRMERPDFPAAPGSFAELERLIRTRQLIDLENVELENLVLNMLGPPLKTSFLEGIFPVG